MAQREAVSLYLGVGGLAAAIFAADLLTPLGVSVWFLYLVPIALTVFGRDPLAPIVAGLGCSALILVTTFSDPAGIIPWMAYVNRAVGVTVIWAIAVLTRGLISTRNRVEADDWIRRAQTQVLEQMQGELSLSDIGTRALRVLSEAIEAPVMAMYAHDGAELRLAASKGLQGDANLPPVFQLGEGLVGEAALSGRVILLNDVPDRLLTIRTALVAGAPRHLIICPLTIDRTVQGVIEAAVLERPDRRVLDLLERARDSVAVAIRTAFYRDRLRNLLEETQRQSEELQAQQEELRVANEELEQQASILKVSQARLEQQQSELEATNAQLETQTLDLEQRRRELSIAKQEAERASQYKSEFLANMSHELRTPLNSTLILAKLLADNKDGRLSEEQVRYAETIYASGTNLLTLINDILDLSKIEAGAVDIQLEQTSPATIVETLSGTFGPLAAEKQLALTVDVSPLAPASIATDPVRLQQILTNLLSNAIKFTDRGSVTLRVAPDGSDAIAFSVADTGIGVRPDQQEIIFEAFRQADGSTHRKHGGTGLGLSISRELAHLLGGDIGVSSEPGKGSVFTLRIPTDESAVRRAQIAARPKAVTFPVAGQRRAQGGADARGKADRPASIPAISDDRERRHHPGRLILVVEDDFAFAQVLLGLAHELEFDCAIATTSDEGMALARSLSPSGILLDVTLPDGSGLALLDRLKRNPDTRHIPVHVVSASDNTQTALALGAVGYALKPVRREELVKVIANLEHRLDQRVRRILVVEDDARLRSSLRELLHLEGVTIHDVGTAKDALSQLATESFDCVVLDLNLPDASGYEILETMSGNERYSFPPVIIYTGRPLTADDEERLRKFSKSVILKGARSPERLLDEVTLFLHQVESRLPPDSQRMLQAARERDELFQDKTILVVEDDVRNVFALTSVFEPMGAKVAIARNGREGIEQVRTLKPDLVLMDIMMPEMDGLTATRELRKDPELRKLPIIALTAKARRDDYEQCLAAGASDYLAKPLDVDKLLSLCRVWMSR